MKKDVLYLVIILLLVCDIGINSIHLVSAWTGPSTNPPNGNASPTQLALWTSTSSNGIYYNSGNVGIGVSSPVASLQVGSSLSMIGFWPSIGFNAYWNNTASAWQYMYSGNPAMWIGADYTNGGVGFYTAPAGTANTNITSNTALFLKSNGNVGVGTVSPGSTFEVLNNGLYSNAEYSGNSIQTSTGHTANADWTLYMGADKTNGLSYIQSVKWGCCTSNLVLNARGGNVGIGTTTPAGTLDVNGTIKQSGKSIGGISGVPTFKATQAYIASNSGWAANGAVFKMASVFDTTGSYNASTGLFTAPIAGYYVFSFSITASQASTATLNDIGLVYNGSANESVFPVQTQTFSTAGWWDDWSYSAPIYMNVNDTVSVMHQCCSGGGTVSAWRGFFAGYYLHP